ncbi:hypothetical protein [Pararhodobacter sp. CCB-MM2]|uniref:hypothetical protein n=1 Tax=Pararhodobacter sp. CCB-MM2 TaxID=1786003 RepID=UPI0008344367|nr:hypothetical protein [Pararhodobacter sp. CCB-MM2]
MILRSTTLSVLAVLAAAPAFADPVTGAEAQVQLYPADAVEVASYDLSALAEQERATLLMVARTQRYYAAVAYAPDAGIIAEPTVMAANYHSPQAARDAALATCNERRNGGTACTLALEVRPSGWSERALMLSADATTGFQDGYAGASGPRALAISPSSGVWGIGTGAEAATAAVRACQGDAGVSDCSVVIAD